MLLRHVLCLSFAMQYKLNVEVMKWPASAKTGLQVKSFSGDKLVFAMNLYNNNLCVVQEEDV